MRILLVDDDQDILNINSIYLEREGYECLLAETLQQAHAIVELENPDLIVLDIMLTDGSGIDFCRKIRDLTIAPIIFLTSLLEEAKKIEALKIGGDDYITKPYKLAELSARIYANLRRMQMYEKKTYEFPPLKIEIESYRVFLHEKEILLTQKEMQLLVILIRNQGTTVRAVDLYEQVWGQPAIDESSMKTLQVHISTLRKKIILDENSPINIKTIRMIGYCFQYEE